MTGSYKEECLKAKRIREGIIDQSTISHGKKKKIAKPWTVYWYMSFGPDFSHAKDARSFHPYSFATEKLAIDYAEKIRRRYQYPHVQFHDRVWVVDDTEMAERRKVLGKKK